MDKSTWYCDMHFLKMWKFNEKLLRYDKEMNKNGQEMLFMTFNDRCHLFLFAIYEKSLNEIF